MNETRPRAGREYPRTITLDGGETITLRLMNAGDADRIVAFARALPADDLLFLRQDITDQKVVGQWVQNLDANRTMTVFAEEKGQLAAYASLHYNDVYWQRHLGEIRVLVGQRWRGRGLGRCVADEVFDLARGLGLRKIIAQMTPDQRGAISTFERLGFQPEALMQDFVVDRDGRTRDMIVMAHDITGLTDRVE